jgi:hypothetical protein
MKKMSNEDEQHNRYMAGLLFLGGIAVIVVIAIIAGSLLMSP